MPEFDTVVFNEEVGKVHGPVKTQFGYHIIKITDKEEGKDVKYEEVEDMVDLIYLQIKTDELLKRLVKKSRD